MGLEAKVVGCGGHRSTEVCTVQNRPHGKSPLVESHFSSSHFFISTSYTPLQPTPTPFISIPFGTIFNPKQKQPSVSETTTTLVPKTSETTLTEPP